MNINWDKTSFTDEFREKSLDNAVYYAGKAPYGKSITYGISRTLLLAVTRIICLAEATFKGLASITKAPLQGNFKSDRSLNFLKKVGENLILIPLTIILFPLLIYGHSRNFETASRDYHKKIKSLKNSNMSNGFSTSRPSWATKRK